MNFLPPQNFVPVPFQYHEEIELRISAITNLGHGIGRINNWVVMVPFVCIGERVRVKIFKNHSTFSEADLVEIIESSEDRICARCKLFGTCGGCQYQHMPYDTQLKLKREHVREAMCRLGGVDAEVNECIPSEYDYAYRSKITPHFQKFKDNEDFSIGFLAHGCRTKLVDVEKCPLATDKINAELKIVRERMRLLSKMQKRGGTLLLRDTDSGVVTDSNAKIVQNIGEFSFKFKAGSFFQNNPHILPKMVNFVINSSAGCKFLVDTYCGVGVFGICGAKYFKDIHGIELDAAAVALAKENAKLNGIANIHFVVGDASRIFDSITYPSEDTCLLIDPPRNGCDKSFTDQLLAFSPKKIVYVSCAPDTQARDVKTLSSKYSVKILQPIDMFPQTRHIENVAIMEIVS